MEVLFIIKNTTLDDIKLLILKDFFYQLNHIFIYIKKKK